MSLIVQVVRDDPTAQVDGVVFRSSDPRVLAAATNAIVDCVERDAAPRLPVVPERHGA